ncbi:breast cancer type 2 susceptibility protein-like, partial [Saccostrea echinata]|uniref:breast cancer type 2 susceptibility protein-like n=1 Tax=Saccostrea echinata TaxID=191078 RepID=UPI002A808CCF
QSEKKLPCGKSGEHHQTLRLSLSKRAKKCFSRSKKRLEEAVGPSCEDWLQSATLRRLDDKKREEERDLFISPVSQCSSQLTPDILKFHRGRKFESSPEVSTFERLLSSQSTTSSPHADWLQPSLGLSPQGREVGALSPTITSEDALIRSLGITANDSVASWTSSLATPSHLSISPAVRQDSCEKEYTDVGKQKKVPRALFSPGLVKSQDELCCSFNEQEQRAESKEDIESNPEIKELADIPVKSEPTEWESEPIFSQELLPEDSDTVENILPSRNEKSSSSVEKDSISLIEHKAVTLKQEVIDETLSDFFDPPSKSVGKRRCAPNRGQKRKSWEDSTVGITIKNSPISSSSPVKDVKDRPNAEMYKTPMESNKRVKSILSNEKRRTRRSSTRKRVTFSHTDDTAKESNEVCTENSELVKEIKIEVTGQSFEQSSSDHSSHLKLNKELISHSNEESDVTTEDVDDLFSQVSPTSLNEMCSLNNENLLTFDENRVHSNTLLNKCDKSPKIIDNIQKQQVKSSDKACKTKSEEDHKLLNSKPKETPVSSNVSSLRCKNRKFSYPTNNQITKSCPKTVYGFKEVESPLQSHHIIADEPGDSLAIQKDETIVSQRLEIDVNRSAQTENPKVSSTQASFISTGFQKFSSMQKVVKKKDCSKDISVPVKVVTEDCGIEQKCNSVRSEKVSTLPNMNQDRNLNIPSTMSNPDKPSEDPSIYYTKPSYLPCQVSNDKSATDTAGETLEIFEGFCTAGGKKFSQTKDALLKARAILEVDTGDTGERTVKETHSEKAPTEKLYLLHSQSRTKFEQVEEDNMEMSSECTAGFQGFHTASGKKVELSESSLRKAQMIISEEGDAKEFPDTGCDSNASEIMPSGDREEADLMTGTHFKGFSSANKLHLREGFTNTAVSSRNVDSGNLKARGKNIFSDIFEEFQVHDNLDSNSFTGFETAGGKEFSSAKIGPIESKAVSKKLDGKEEHFTNIDEEEIIQTLFSGMKNKGISDHKSKPTSGFPLKPQKTDQLMKSSSIAAKFPPGSNIPKGFRPFKPPKILAKPKSKDSTHKASNVVKRLDETKSEVSSKNKMHKSELTESTPQTESSEERKMNENSNQKETDAEKPDDSADLSNLFLNDMFDEEMEISQKFTLEAIAERKVHVSDANESRVSVERKEERVPSPSCNKLKDCTEPVDKQVIKSSAGMTESSFSGFQTASGKTVSIDDKSLKKAKELWEKQTVEISDKFDDLDPEITFKDKEVILHADLSDSCSTDFEGKTVNMCQTIEETLNEASDKPKTGNSSAVEDEGYDMTGEFKGFQTASGKSVSVDKQSLSVATELWEKSLGEDFLKPVHRNSKSETFQGFHTASGKTVSVCDDSILEAKKLWEKPLDVPSGNKNKDGMKSSMGEHANVDRFNPIKLVDISKSAFSKSKKSLENFSADNIQISISPCDIARNEPSQDKFSFHGFQTASGKVVKVDEKAVAEAKKLWTSSTEENNDNFPESELEKLFLHDNFSQTVTKDTNSIENTDSMVTLKETSENIQAVPKLNDPKAAAKSLNVLQKFQSKPGKENESVQSSVSLSPFISASGKSVHVSDQALVHIRCEMKKLDDCEQNIKTLNKNENAKPIEKSSANIVACPFMSASGKQISVSSAALESTKSFFSEDNDEVSLLTTERKNFSRFQMDSVKSVSLSQKSQEVMKAKFADKHEMETSDSTTVEPRLKEKPFSPFQSASGKSISVSQKSLDMVRSKLAENCETDSKEQSSKALDNGKTHPEISPFQSASVKSIAVTKESLEMAQKRLDENNEGNIDKPTRHSCDGSSVVSQINTQKRKLEDMLTPKRPRNKDVGDPGEYDNLVLPDDFFDDMETPNKKIKMDSEDESNQNLGGISTERKNLAALSTVPEGYTKDRSNFYSKPLKCENPIDAHIRNAQIKAEEAKKQTTHASTIQSSTFRTPYKAGTGSITTPPNPVVKSVQPVFVPKTKPCGQPLSSLSINKTVNKPSTQHTSCPEQSIPSRTDGVNKDGYLNALNTAMNKQEDMIKSSRTVKPSAGRLFQLKNSGQRVRLREVITRSQGNTCLGSVSPSVCSVRASSAAKHKFYLPDFYGSDVTQVYVGDGALLVPDEKGFTGMKEMYKAFLTIDSVDCSLINEAWFCNHYRWIVWKLASYEVASPDKFGGRALTPENVMLQMKYRYDREIDSCHRSALRKIMERDDTSTKRLVLCVSGIYREQQCRASTPASKQQAPQETEVTVELTDGWYCIPAKLDVPLLDLVNKKRIQTGHKLCTSGAELVGSQEPCSPFEAPASLQLKINFNSTRPVPWDTMLGFQMDPRPLCVPLSETNGEGGMVGCIDVILGRKYPLMYMEKLPGGGSIFRTAQAEEKFSQLHQKQEQEAKETLYRKIENKFDKEDYEESCAVKRQWSKGEIEDLQCGQEVWEALRTAKRPDIIEGYLSDSQLRSLMDYKQELHQRKLQRLQNEFQKAWNDEQGDGKSRNVVPLLKLRVVGLSKKDVDFKISTIISVWRPGQEVMELKEGQRYKILSLSASQSRTKFSQYSVQLTANRQTKFLPLGVDENLLDMVFEPREVLCACDLKRRQPIFGELDIVCLLVSTEAAEINERNQEILYGMDKNGDIIGIKFWGGLKAFGMNTTLTVGTLFCGSNIQDKFPYRSSILPVVEASLEFSVFTKSPQGPTQRNAYQVLTERIKTSGEKTLIERGQQLVTELLEKKRNMTLGHTPTKNSMLESADHKSMAENVSPHPQHSVHQAKMAQLMSYGSPSPLSPIPTKVTPSARKKFKIPKPADV